MNKEELALHFLQEYYNIPTNWEDYKTIKNAIRENQQLKEQLEKSEKAREEAIEYINDKSDKGYNFGWILQNEEIDKLLEILDIDKGE